MERIILKDIPVSLTFEDLIQRLMLTEEEDLELMEPLFNEALSIASPKAVLAPFPIAGIQGDAVTIGTQVFRSGVLAKNLAQAKEAYAYVVSCGTEVDDWSHRVTEDPIVGLWLDILKEMILGEARGVFLDRARKATGQEMLASMSPGSGNLDVWPIEQQRPLFSLIGNVREDTGVMLTESCLMLPTKSVSGVLFPSQKEFITCSICSRIRCQNRRAPYQGD